MIKNLEHQVKMEFGTGDIGFNAGAIKEDDGKIGIVIFYNQEARKIGDAGDIKAGTEVDINSFPVVMKFYRKESIDVVVKALLEAKRDMLGSLLNNISDEEIEETGVGTGNIVCEECAYESGEMDIKSAVFRINMQGGYFMFDGEGGTISKCPKCEEDSMWIEG